MSEQIWYHNKTCPNGKYQEIAIENAITRSYKISVRV
jgi:hypothetical protein